MFFRCLKAGMKPELVDATFRRKSFTRPSQGQAAVFEEPTLIDNFRPLEKDDISDFLQVCAYFTIILRAVYVTRAAHQKLRKRIKKGEKHGEIGSKPNSLVCFTEFQWLRRPWCMSA